MSFIDNIDLGSKYEESQSRISSRRGTVFSKSKRATIFSKINQKGINSRANSVASCQTPVRKFNESKFKRQDYEDPQPEDRTNAEIEDIESFDFLEQRSRCYN